MKKRRETSLQIRLAAIAIISLFIILAAAAYVSGWQIQRSSDLIASDAVPGTIAAHKMRMAMSRSIGWVMVAASAQTTQSRDASLKIVHDADMDFANDLKAYEATIKINPVEDRKLLNHVINDYAEYARKRKGYEALIIAGDRNRSAAFLERDLVPAYVVTIKSAEELLRYNRTNSLVYSMEIRHSIHLLYWVVAVVMMLALVCAGVLVVNLAVRRWELAELQESEELFRTSFESATVGVCLVAMDGRFLNVNSTLCDMLGYTREELLQLTFNDVTYEEDKDIGRTFLSKALSAGPQTMQAEKRYLHKDGQVVWVNLSTALVEQSRDHGGYMISYLQDITERKQATEQLEMLKVSIDNHFDGAFWMDTENHFVYVNDTACKVLGYTREELLGHPVTLISPSSTPQNLTDVWMQLRETGFLARESIHRRKDGSELPVEIVASYVNFEGKEFNCGFARDITERKRAEEILREKQDQLILAMDIAKLAHWEFDVANNMLTGDEELFHLLGTTSEQEGGPSMSPEEYIQRFVHPLDADIVAHQVALASATTDPDFAQQFEQRIIRKDGTEGVMMTRSRIVMNDSGQAGIIHGTYQDITEQKQAEAELQKAYSLLEEERQSLTRRVEQRTAELSESNAKLARADQAKSEFLSRMSHELRTPLNAILGFGQLLQMDKLTDIQEESIDRILGAGRHLLQLINEVLDIAGIEAGRMEFSLEPVSVRDVLEESVSLVQPLAAERGIKIAADTSLDEIREYHILTDRQRIIQVMLNLLGNAIKYNRQDGSVTYGVTVVPPAADAVTSMLRIYVRDTGLGIPPEKMERLFVPFDRLGAEQTRIEGSGLGLALTRQLVMGMGGTISADSTIDSGSTFWFELPLVEATHVSVNTRSDSLPTLSSHIDQSIILYIEDNLSNLDLVEKILKGYPNLKFVSAMQGGIGIDIARSQQPDLILLDLHLPDMHGKEVLATLNGDPLTSGIPVVILSADASPSQIERMLAAGAKDYLTKPIDLPQFMRILEKNLSK